MLTKLFGTKSTASQILDPNNIPHHVAIIMDGNGRWAKRRGLPRAMGHRAGADVLKKIARAADKIGIKVLTVYGFLQKIGNGQKQKYLFNEFNW